MQSGRVSKDNDNTMQMTHAMTCAQHLELEPMTLKECCETPTKCDVCVLFTFFECFMMCVRLFQVVQLSCFSWFLTLFAQIVSTCLRSVWLLPGCFMLFARWLLMDISSCIRWVWVL